MYMIDRACQNGYGLHCIVWARHSRIKLCRLGTHSGTHSGHSEEHPCIEHHCRIPGFTALMAPTGTWLLTGHGRSPKKVIPPPRLDDKRRNYGHRSGKRHTHPLLCNSRVAGGGGGLDGLLVRAGAGWPQRVRIPILILMYGHSPLW